MNIENIISFILFGGFIQGLFLGFFLLTHKKGNWEANRFLAIIILILSFSLILTQIFERVTLLKNLHEFFNLLTAVFFLNYGPLFYFYSKSLIYKKFKLTFKKYITFIPFIIFFIFIIFFNIYIKNKEAIYYLQIIFSFIAALYLFFFIFIIIRLLSDYSKLLKTSFSSIERINFKWLIFLLISFYSIFLIGYILDVINDILKLEVDFWFYASFLISINIYIIGYFALRQPELFTRQFDKEFSVNNLKKKYEKSDLTEERAREYYEKIKKTMDEEKPYLDNNITLLSLSKKMLIKTHHFSQVINEKFNKNFFDFINYHRIEEAKKMIIAPENSNINISSIAYDSGFNSLSAFNTAFKKYTGITPSQFRNKIN